MRQETTQPPSASHGAASPPPSSPCIVAAHHAPHLHQLSWQGGRTAGSQLRCAVQPADQLHGQAGLLQLLISCKPSRTQQGGGGLIPATQTITAEHRQSSGIEEVRCCRQRKRGGRVGTVGLEARERLQRQKQWQRPRPTHLAASAPTRRRSRRAAGAGTGPRAAPQRRPPRRARRCWLGRRPSGTAPGAGRGRPGGAGARAGCRRARAAGAQGKEATGP